MTTPNDNIKGTDKSEVKLNDIFYIVHCGKNNTYIDIENNQLFINRDIRKSWVQKVYLCAIAKLEIVEESKKYFFTVKEKYHYSNELGGVSGDYSFFTLDVNNPDNGIGRTNNHDNVFCDINIANHYAEKLDKGLADNNLKFNERIRENIKNVLEQL